MRRVAAALARAGDGVRGLVGWRRHGLAVAAGALAAAALPPVHALPVLVVSFPLLLWLVEGAEGRRAAFAVGWGFGFGHFVAGLYWIAFAFLVDAERFGWMAPFAVAGLSAYLGLFPAGVALAARVAPAGPARVLVLAAAWSGLEWLRGWLLTGFPWNLIGSAWVVSEAMIQFAALAGAYGLSLVTVAVAAVPALVASPAGAGPRAGGRSAPAAAALAAGALAALWAGGALRLAAAEGGDVAGVRLRVVQGNIPQDHKWKAALRELHFRTYLALTAEPSSAPPTLVIWPETAAPYLLTGDAARRQAVAQSAPPGAIVVTGAIRIQPDPPPAASDAPVRAWNSLLAIDSAGRVVATYDKAHLVPFGEYLPWRGLLAPLGLEKLAQGRGDFSAGPGPVTLSLPGAPPLSPLICYEIIFPARVLAGEGARPGWMLNLTNDAWFGTTSGPYQHFAAARLRAVEEGLPVVRAANTGISAVVDAYGRVRARLGLNLAGVIDHGLPRALDGATVYGRLGDLAFAPWLAAALALAALLGRRRRGTPT
ncbi:MAG: apolipoprotein N-acyltransferase [Proteobacteria bacterium]|nr:apolipoprotein N-acyltransferase [Pseudomonadota bacterium]